METVLNLLKNGIAGEPEKPVSLSSLKSCRNWGWIGAETRIVLDYDGLALETTA